MIGRLRTVAHVTAIVLSDALFCTGFTRASAIIDAIIETRRR